MYERLLIEMTEARTAPLVPEVTLRLARDAAGIFVAVDAIERPGVRMPPYWAFAWPGGQATARWLLDHAAEVAGKRVVDIGAGSGVAAIAAALAGAATVLAADIDPLATVAIGINARANGVQITTTTEDVLGTMPPADLVLLGDLVYEPETAVRVAAVLDKAAREGGDVLVADRIQARRLPVGGLKRGRDGAPVAFDLVGTYDAPLTPTLDAHPFERARLWRLHGQGRRGTRR